ncbi:hypothetical protein LEN26_016388 [Aphanomyces euteiches]|nr:hypothetical protein LEN26_016388 [Aphanomyces euteiches]
MDTKVMRFQKLDINHGKNRPGNRCITLHVFSPRSNEEWRNVEAGLAAIAGFPNVAGVVDGSLVKKPRPQNFWGWCIRKGFVAYNKQGVVDSNMFFMDFSVRPGGCNEMSLWSRSVPGVACADGSGQGPEPYSPQQERYTRTPLAAAHSAEKLLAVGEIQPQKPTAEDPLHVIGWSMLCMSVSIGWIFRGSGGFLRPEETPPVSLDFAQL